MPDTASKKLKDAHATLGILGGKVKEQEWEFVQMVRDYLKDITADVERLEAKAGTKSAEASA